MISVEVAQANADNVKKLVEYVGHYKERMLKMKENLVKERGEEWESKRKHEATLSDFEKLQKAYQHLELEKDELVLLDTITGGEKKDLERKILESKA